MPLGITLSNSNHHDSMFSLALAATLDVVLCAWGGAGDPGGTQTSCTPTNLFTFGL